MSIHKRIAYVTVTIPVDLEAEVPLANDAWWTGRALLEFVQHPAMRFPKGYLDAFVDEIRFEDVQACAHCGDRVFVNAHGYCSLCVNGMERTKGD